MWQVTPSAAPSGDWALGLATAARACADSERGAVIIVPDQADLDRLSEACTQVLGATGFAVLVAEAGPAARYRAFLSALRGEVRVVIGNRAAAYAPVHDLGLVALWDDGDDLLAEQRAPYPHARDVLALRADVHEAGVLFASYARTAELQAWLERGWLRELADDRVVVRHTAPRVKVTADSDFALERDPAARAARLPHEVFEMMRASLPQGPVLVQVPRGGYLVALVCQGCREPARCRFCGGPTRVPASRAGEAATARASCAWCGRPQIDWECPICGSRRVRAPIVGAERTAEELGKAFPQTPVRQSSRREADRHRGGYLGDRGGYAWSRAAGRGRLRRCGAAGHAVVAAPPGSASGRGGVTALAQCGRAGAKRRRRRFGHRGRGELGTRVASPGARRSRRFRRARAGRTSRRTVSRPRSR